MSKHRCHEGAHDPAQEVIATHVEAGTCPWCGMGPFVMLPVHTNKSHGVDKNELRRLAGLPVGEATSSPEVRAKMRAEGLRRTQLDPELISRMTAASREAKGGEKAIATVMRNRARRRERLAVEAEKLWHSGLYASEISARLGIKKQTAAEYLADRGITQDGPTQMKRRREKHISVLRAGRERRNTALLAERLAVVDQHGWTLEGLRGASKELGFSAPKRLYRYLRENGYEPFTSTTTQGSE